MALSFADAAYACTAHGMLTVELLQACRSEGNVVLPATRCQRGCTRPGLFPAAAAFKQCSSSSKASVWAVLRACASTSTLGGRDTCAATAEISNDHTLLPSDRYLTPSSSGHKGRVRLYLTLCLSVSLSLSLSVFRRGSCLLPPSLSPSLRLSLSLPPSLPRSFLSPGLG